MENTKVIIPISEHDLELLKGIVYGTSDTKEMNWTITAETGEDVELTFIAD